MSRTNLSESFNAKPPAGPFPLRVTPHIIARNTFQYMTADGHTVTRLHLTDIARVSPDKTKAIVTSGGWQTVTTRDRLNIALRDTPFGVFSGRGSWLVGIKGNGPWEASPDCAIAPFFDGMSLPRDMGSPTSIAEGKRQAKLKAQIKAFVAKALPYGKPIPKPGNGDCWYCLMFDSEHVDTHESNGHTVHNPKDRDSSHILDHVQKGYMPGALVVNAWRNVGVSDAGINYLLYRDRLGKDDYARIRARVRKYIQKRLGLEF